MRDHEVGDPSYRCQIHGVLAKKPIGSQVNKWSKRFFIIKDGYLLYYAENEKKEFEKKKIINTHPKGIVPLGGCIIQTSVEPGQPFSIHMKNDDIIGDFVVAADSEYERDKWLTVLKQSARITWSNAQVGDAMIEELENRGMQMAKEKHDYFGKLQYEAMALHDEKLKTEELERLNEELQKERNKMEEHSKELKEQYEKIKQELDGTVEAMNAVEEDKLTLNAQSMNLQKTLESLESEKQATLHRLDNSTASSKRNSQTLAEKSLETEKLKETLVDIELKTQRFIEEKALAEERLQEAELRARQLEDDKKAMMDLAEDLKVSIKDLVSQKEVTENELKEEVLARLEAEKRLKQAETSLGRLEKAVVEQGEEGRDSEEVKEEMIGDVKTLKKFFENLMFEAKLDADKSVMIKNSIHARKTMVRRAKTMKFEASKKRRSRDSQVCLRSPVSPCEITHSTAVPPRLTQSTIFPLEEENNDLPWMRHSVIGLQNMSLSPVSDDI